ncbi:MerR family transcriptional regulator [Chloroflexota bacterium]
MIALRELLEKTGITYHTVVKYVNMGILPRATRVWRGRKGSQSIFSDEAVDIINRVKLEKKHGIPLAQIATRIQQERDQIKVFSPKDELLIPVSADAMKSYLDEREDFVSQLNRQIDEQMPGYELDSMEMELIPVDGEKYLRPRDIKVKPKAGKEVKENGNE